MLVRNAQDTIIAVDFFKTYFCLQLSPFTGSQTVYSNFLMCLVVHKKEMKGLTEMTPSETLLQFLPSRNEPFKGLITDDQVSNIEKLPTQVFDSCFENHPSFEAVSSTFTV